MAFNMKKYIRNEEYLFLLDEVKSIKFNDTYADVLLNDGNEFVMGYSITNEYSANEIAEFFTDFINNDESIFNL